MNQATPLLMTPGPTRVPERVLQAGNCVIHHRTPAFSEALLELVARARPLFGASAADILPVHGTGRAAMEGAIVNFFLPGDTVVACVNGSFGEMWSDFAERYRLNVVRVGTDWESCIDPEEVAAVMEANPGVRAVTIVQSDTSSGVLNPVAEVARVARGHGALTLVDGISSVGGVPFLFDEWDLDFAVTSSQKCLMSSPGLALAVVGPRAWEMAEHGGMPRAYLDFESIRQIMNRSLPETPGTTPTSLVFQLLEAERMIHEEGLQAVFDRHVAMASRVRERTAELGYGLAGSAIRERSPTLTALTVPDGVDPEGIRTHVLEANIQIADGLGSYKSNTFRIGHMGDIRMPDVDRTLDALIGA